MNAREILRAASVRDIPRACGCGWRMLLRDRRPDGWELEKASASCRFHGEPRPAPKAKRPRRPAEDPGGRQQPVPVPADGEPLDAAEFHVLVETMRELDGFERQVDAELREEAR